MRICFVSRRYFPAVSGMSVYAKNLITQLAAMGHDVVMVSQYREDDAGVGIYGGGPPPDVPGVKVIGLRSFGEEASATGPADFEGDIAAMVDAIETAHEAAPFDIIHAQYCYPTGLAALEASRRLGVPNVISIQGGDGHWVGGCCATHKAAMAAVLHGAMRLLIGSRSFAREVENNHGTPQQRFTIVPGAVDTARFAPRGRVPGALSDPPRLLYHGRVDRRKGALEFLDAAADVLRRRDATVIVSGIGPDLDNAKLRAADLGINVAFTGHADYDGAPAIYHRGDIFVSPTHAEGFSNTILEAMASGLPIVSCDTVGVVDCLRDGENGLLVPVSDHMALVGAIERLLSDGSLRHQLAAAALHEARTRYAWQTVAHQIAGIYDEVRDAPVPCDWTAHYDVAARSVDAADLSCRFRAAPHLL